MQAIDPPPMEARWRGPARERLSQMPTWHLFDGHTDGNLIDGHPATASNSTDLEAAIHPGQTSAGQR